METVERSVSPSLVEASRLERRQAEAATVASRKRKSTAKRRTSDAMNLLDTLAASNHIDSHAYDCMAKALKRVHEASDDVEARHRRKLLVELVARNPYVQMDTPNDVDTFDPDFVRDVLRKKRDMDQAHLRTITHPATRAVVEHTASEQRMSWLRELVAQYLGPDCPSFPLECRRGGIMMLLHANREVFAEPIREYLETELPFVCACEVFDGDDDRMEQIVEMAPCLEPWVDRCMSGNCPMNSDGEADGEAESMCDTE